VSAVGRPARAVLVLLVTALAVALAGCARLPTDGPVQAVPGEREQVGGVRALAPAPARDAAPARIAADFLLAAADSDLTRARAYLTASAAASWRPTRRTVVYGDEGALVEVLSDGRTLPDGETVPADVTEVLVRTALDVHAVVDEQGRYVAAPPGERYEARWRMVRDADRQWRVADLPDELLVSDFGFDQLMRPVPLYFPDFSGAYLVPDLRWFPDRTSLPTTVVAELLSGPAAWLAPAVRRVAPTGTTLSLETVAVTGGRAQVDLSGDVLATAPEDRRLLEAQLQATLQPLPGIATVQILVDGAELSLTGSQPVLRRDSPVDAPVRVLAGPAVARLAPDRPVPLDDVPAADGLGPSHLGVGVEAGLYGVLTAERSQLRLLREGAEAPGDPVVTGADLTAPSFDRYGWVWTAPATAEGAVSAVRTADAGTVGVEAAWLEGRRLGALRLARDGCRAAVVTTVDGEPRVDVVGVARARDGRPTSLVHGAGDLLPGLVAIADVAWVDETTLAVLGRRAEDDAARVWLVPVSGPQTLLRGAVPGGVAVTAGRGPQSLHVGTRDARVLARTGAAWTEVAAAGTARWPAFPG
jgi:hypothetical protein